MYTRSIQRTCILLLVAASGLFSALVMLMPAPAYAGTQTFTSSGTWTRPAGVTVVTVYLIGGGGGGSGAQSGGNGGKGGGGGGCTVATVTVSGNVAVTIGAGGAGGTGGVEGTAVSGGNTTFGSLASANGGTRGNGHDSQGQGGAAGTGCFQGGNGGNGSGGGNKNGGGGGGAAGFSGAGQNGTAGTTGAIGNGGAGGSGNPGTGNGGNGGEWDNTPAPVAGSTYGGGGGGGGYPGGGNFHNGAAGASGYARVEWDETPPTPNPMTFASAPAPTSATAIGMTATTASDPQGGIQYEFDFVACSSNGGTGGTDGAFQSSTSYSDTGLQANQCYGYRVRARDANQNTGSFSSTVETYTFANVPSTPTIQSQGFTTALLFNNANGNAPHTEFTVQILDTSPNDAAWEDKYVAADGTPSNTAVWLTDAQLDGIVLTGLTQGTSYAARAKARNGDGIETDWSDGSSGATTMEQVTRYVRLLGGVRLGGVRLR